jgi:hypothetical protein
MTAIISPCGLYRYFLRRTWSNDASHGTCCFIMLNPSTADAMKDDPTIRRCQAFAQSFGCDTLEVVNLFALRSPAPVVLYKAPRDEIVGPSNDHYIMKTAYRARFVICAWGQHGKLFDRGSEVLAMLRAAHVYPQALRINAGGQPAHPLYLPADLEPFVME